MIVLTPEGPLVITIESPILASVARIERFFGRVYATPEKREEVKQFCADFVRKETGHETA